MIKKGKGKVVMEIERKFLLDKLPFELDSFEHLNILQGYISTDPTIRLRRQNDTCILTVKGSGLMAKEEFELEINLIQFENLWKKVEGGIIRKKRYLVPIENGYTSEIDIYENKELEGLLTVEVEFDTVLEAESFNPPNWFGIDVTSDRRYKNTNLSKLVRK